MSIEGIEGLIVIPGLTEPTLGAHVGPNATLKRYIETNIPLLHTTKGEDQYLLKLWATRKAGSPMTSSDGVDEGIGYFRVDNEADNGDYCRQRVLRMRCRNHSGASLVHMKGLEIEMDNRGTITDHQVGLRIWMKNVPLGAETLGASRALEIEMGEQGAPTAHHRAIDIRHNDPSNVTYPTAIVIRGDRTTNGFVYGIDFQQYGLDLKGQASADSAVFKLHDDGENVDLDNGTVLNDISAQANAGYLKVVVGSTVRYIALYAAHAGG